MRDRRCRRPRDDYLNSTVRCSLSTTFLVVVVAGSTCAAAAALPFDEFLGGDEKHISRHQNDFFGRYGGGGYSVPAVSNPPAAASASAPAEPAPQLFQEGVEGAAAAVIPSPVHSDQDGGGHFEAPNPVPFQGHQGGGGGGDDNPDWEVLTHHNNNPYTEPYHEYTEYDMGNYPDYSAYTYDDETSYGGGEVKTDEKRPAHMLPPPSDLGISHHHHPSPEEIDHDMSREDLETFLSQFYLIKTQHGYILGRSLPPAEFAAADLAFNPTQLAQQQHQQFQQLHQGEEPREAEGLTKRKSNFQLRVRKRYDPSIFFNSPAPAKDKRGRNFQLRVRKDDKRAPNFQLRVRKDLKEKLEKRSRSFQLRVRKSGDALEEEKRRSFQLRVRKAEDNMADFVKRARNFQLRVRKSGGFLEEDKRSPFQLRVRKSDEEGPEPEKRARNFQLRVRKDGESAEIEKKSPSFQLRVRKNQVQRRAPNFQLRVRKDEKRARNFQLRVRRGSDQKRARSFQLRVRREPLAQLVNDKRGVHNFQLRVRKDDHPALKAEKTTAKRGRSFQLRVRKSDEEVDRGPEEEEAGPSLMGWLPPDKRARNFQLRVRKAEEEGRRMAGGMGLEDIQFRKRSWNWQRPLRRSSSFQLRVRRKKKKKSLLPEELDLDKRGQFQLRV